jgi:hypothetical protein
VALARTVLQRRLASSLGAIQATLTNRRDRFVTQLEELDRLTPAQQERRLRELRLLEVDPELEGDDQEEELQDSIAVQATAAERMEDMRAEVQRLDQLLDRTAAIPRDQEAKLKALDGALARLKFKKLPEAQRKLLIFTEYRATQDHLVRHLEAGGYSVCTIHGGMPAQARKQAEHDFRTEREICVATEAAGEGINLQFCHLMINYDIPWNPNRLEQRMGRIHRIGQTRPVTVFNFVAENTVEGQILRRLLAKLDEIRRALGSDRVFDVIGTLLQRNDVNLEEMLREASYDPDRVLEYEAQIERISMEELERYEQATGIALATRQVNLERVRPKDWRSEERRLMPEFVERFFLQAAERVRLRIEPRADGLWRVEHVPQRLRSNSLPGVRRYGFPASGYRKLTFEKHLLISGRHDDAELCSPGHPLFAATADLLDEQLAASHEGCAGFIDPGAVEPYRLYFFELKILGELGPESPGGLPRPTVVHAELAVVVEHESGGFELAAPDILHDLTPADGQGVRAHGADDARRAERWLRVHRSTDLVGQHRARRRRELEIRREYLERSFYELEKRRRARWAELAAKVAAGDDSYRLARDEALRQMDETERRREQKLAELAHLEVLRPGPATFVGSAVVLPLGESDVASVARRDRTAEHRAVEIALAYERAHGWEPEYIGDDRDGSGFDIRSTRTRPDGGPPDVRRIEVKGHLGSDAACLLTPNEWTQARRHGDSFWLYVVTDCSTHTPQLLRVQNPHAKLGRRARTLTVVKGIVLPADAVERAAEEQP